MAKFDPFLSLDCARVEGVGAQSKERKGSNFAAQRSGAIVLQARRAEHLRFKNLAIAIWQPCLQLVVRRQRAVHGQRPQLEAVLRLLGGPRGVLKLKLRRGDIAFSSNNQGGFMEADIQPVWLVYKGQPGRAYGFLSHFSTEIS